MANAVGYTLRLRAIRLGSTHSEEWQLAFILMLLEPRPMSAKEFANSEEVKAAVELLRVAKGVEERRLGPKYHSSSGSLSRLFDLLVYSQWQKNHSLRLTVRFSCSILAISCGAAYPSTVRPLPWPKHAGRAA